MCPADFLTALFAIYVLSSLALAQSISETQKQLCRI